MTTGLRPRKAAVLVERKGLKSVQNIGNLVLGPPVRISTAATTTYLSSLLGGTKAREERETTII